MKKVLSLVIAISMLFSCIVPGTIVSAKGKAPKAPSITVVRRDTGTAEINWKASASQYYSVEMRTGAGKYKVIQKYLKGLSTYTKTGLKEKTSYSFRVRTYKKSGSKKLYSGYSKIKKVILSKLKIKYLESRLLETTYENSVAGLKAYDTWATGDEPFMLADAFAISVNNNIYFATTYSAVENSKYVTLTFANKKVIRCDNLYSYNKEKNIAILIPNEPVTCKAFTLANSATIGDYSSIYSLSDYLVSAIPSAPKATSEFFQSSIEENGVKKLEFLSLHTIFYGTPIVNNKGEVFGFGSYTGSFILFETEKAANITTSENLQATIATPVAAAITSLPKTVTFATLPGSKLPVPDGASYTTKDGTFDTTEIGAISYTYASLDINAYKTKLEAAGYKKITEVLSNGDQSLIYRKDFSFCTISYTAAAKTYILQAALY